MRWRLMFMASSCEGVRRWTPEGAHRLRELRKEAQDAVDRPADPTREGGEHRDRRDADDGEHDCVLGHRLSVFALADCAKKPLHLGDAQHSRYLLFLLRFATWCVLRQQLRDLADR